MTSIEDDDGTTEYDVTEHLESLQHGIPDHFGMLWCCELYCCCMVKFSLKNEFASIVDLDEMTLNALSDLAGPDLIHNAGLPSVEVQR